MLSRPNGELRDGHTAHQSRPLIPMSQGVLPPRPSLKSAGLFRPAVEPSMPFDFQQLANFRLARGSHKQPNKGGNICVNEAAVIAAGFQYREIKDVSCLPDCFSRPVSEYAIYLNDFMMHRVRNELLVPFISRLPGTSDAPWVEEERARLIVVETVRRIVAAEYDEVWGKPKLAARFRAVQLFEQVSPADLAIGIPHQHLGESPGGLVAVNEFRPVHLDPASDGDELI